VIDSAAHARDVRCIINMVHRTYLIFVKNALLLLVEAAAYGGMARVARNEEGRGKDCAAVGQAESTVM
jgi:hypothetical protein